MGSETNISWTWTLQPDGSYTKGATWNPLGGCSKKSEGCRNCYAMSVAARFSGPGLPYEGLAKMVNGKPAWTNEIRLFPDKLDQPLRWKRGRKIFVNSMSDLFHEDVPIDYIAQVFAVMNLAAQHTFMVLTKRPQHMAQVLNNPLFDELVATKAYEIAQKRRITTMLYSLYRVGLPNVWLGTSIEDNRVAERADWLRQTPAAIRFLSLEPLIGPVDQVNLLDIDWVITGGESGRGYRPLDLDWVRDVRDRCAFLGTAFFHKQGSGLRSGMDRELDGVIHDAFPERVLVSRRSG